MIAALFAALLAQTDPTPFWMPPPPPKTEKEKKEQPKKKKKPPAVQVKPLEIPAEPPTWIEPGDTRSGQSSGTVSGDSHPTLSPNTVPKSSYPVVVPNSPSASPPPEAARVPQPVTPPPRPQPPPPRVPAPIVVEAPEPEPPAPELRRWTVNALAGAWGVSRSDGTGRSWDFTYGLRGGYALSESAEIDLQLARSAVSVGSPFVSASAARHLAVARVFWVWGDSVALLLGGGGGATVVHTVYTLLPSTDPGATASDLPATAIKGVIEITAAGRARFFRGLEARAEVSLLLRDGRVELLPLFAVGAAF